VTRLGRIAARHGGVGRSFDGRDYATLAGGPRFRFAEAVKFRATRHATTDRIAVPWRNCTDGGSALAGVAVVRRGTVAAAGYIGQGGAANIGPVDAASIMCIMAQ